MSDSIDKLRIQNILSERVTPIYDVEEQEAINDDRDEYMIQLKKLKRTGIKMFPNQEVIALDIIKLFCNKKIVNAMVVARTQSGKTGTMCATITRAIEDINIIIPLKNTFIITGLSDVDWKNQTKERMPECIQKRIYHRNDLLNTFVKEVKNKKNVLIIMDEIQVAAQENQTIHNAFKEAGLLDLQNLYERDIKILEFTATPDGTIYGLMGWGEASAKIIADPGNGYVSSYDLLQQGRVKQYKDLSSMNDINEIFEELKEDIQKYTEPRYHIIRIKSNQQTKKNFLKFFGKGYDYKDYDQLNKSKNINEILSNSPMRHTFIFIKEMLRCAKTFEKKHIGVLYERYSKNPDDSVIIQGLLGRDTGYDNNGSSIIYTNVDTIERYEQIWNSKFEKKDIKWSSKTTGNSTMIKDNKISFNSTSLYKNFDKLDNKEQHKEMKEPMMKQFCSQKEVIEYYKNNLKSKLGGTGPMEIKPNEEGFYEVTICSIKKVYLLDEIYATKRTELYKEKNNYRMLVGYKDINDNTTAVWILKYYE